MVKTENKFIENNKTKKEEMERLIEDINFLCTQ